MGVIARQSIKASIVGIIGVLIGAFSKLFIFTKFLQPDEIGLLDVITKMTLLMIAFFVLGSPQVIKKYFARFSNKENDGGLVYTYGVILIGSILVSSILYLILKPIITQSYIENSPLLLDYLNLPLYCSIAFAIYLFANAIGAIQMRIVVPSIFNQIVNRVLVMFVIMAYGLYHVINLDTLVYLYALCFFGIPAIGTVLYLIFVIKPDYVVAGTDKMKQIIKVTREYNFYLVLSVASGYIIQAIDAYMISAKIDLASAGIYSIVFYMGTVIQIPKKALANLSLPYLSKALKEDRQADVLNIYKQSSLNQLLVGALIFLCVWLNIDSLFEIIPNGSVFKMGKLVVLYIGFGKLFDMSLGVNRQIIEASKHYRFNLGINILLSVLVIVLNLIFIPLESEYFGGINGAAFASMLAMIISNLIALVLIKVKLNMQPLNLKTLIVSSITLLIGLAYPFISVKLNSGFLNIIINSIIIVIVYVALNLLFRTADEAKDLIIKTLKGFKK